MTGFYQWETKTLILKIKPVSALQGVKSVIVSIAQSRAMIEKHTDDLTIDEDAGTISVYLHQEETARFTVGSAQVQVNLLYHDAERDTTVKGSVQVWDNLHKEVMA